MGIIFDCDGTLVDSEVLHYQGWNAALEKHGAFLTLEDYFPLVGNPPMDVARSLQTKFQLPSAEELMQDKRTHYTAVFDEVPSIERTVRFLKLLGEQKDQLDIKIGVASAGHRVDILAHLGRLGVLHLVDVVVSGKDDLGHIHDPEGVNKPKPYVYLRAAELLGIDPTRCVAFEDSRPGLLAAVRAGMITFAVPNLYTLQHDFSQANFVMLPDEEFDSEQFFAQIEGHL